MSDPLGKPPVHVVAGVIADARGRILLARRTAGRDLAGAWEFPGGKSEAGETAFEALQRELHEELGIRVAEAQPLIRVPQAYPGKRIVLDVHRVGRYSGIPRGRENQALAWVPPEKLPAYAMPPADRPVVAAINDPPRYLVTPEPTGSPAAFLAKLEKTLQAGHRLVQLRARTLDADSLAPLARKAASLCQRYQARLLLNGHPALAESLSIGLHLRSAQLLALEQRPLPTGLCVAASCHDAVELARAQALGLDFALLGPVMATTSHPGQAPLGWEAFARLREIVSLPIYAIGGLATGDETAARAHGAQGVAGISAFWPA